MALLSPDSLNALQRYNPASFRLGSFTQHEHEPVLFPLFALASDSGAIIDDFVFPEPYFIKILDGLTFKLEVDVGVTVPGFVECIATIQSSIF